MPLDREHVTAASRIMLPTYVALTLALGLVYTFDPLHRLHGIPALAAQRAVMGGQMWPWGLLFLALSGLMLAAFLQRRRQWFVFALYGCAAAFLMWAVLYTVSIFLDPTTSLLAPAYPLFVVRACRASAKSLLRGER